MSEDRRLTSGQVARMFDVTPQTPYRWAKEGKLPKEAFIVTPGGRYLFRESYIRAFLEARNENRDRAFFA